MAVHPKVPYGVMDFRRIREEGHSYVNQTSYISKMEERDGFAFFVRPRRMGKPLFVDMLRRLEQIAEEAM